MKVRLRMAAILFFMVYDLTFGCEIDDVAVYNVSIKMFWSEERFLKDYPLYSPKAQWSQVIGQSHNKTYTLYHVGDVARPSVRKFAQTGDVHELMMEGDEEPKVYDQFVAPSVGKGTGDTGNMVLVDGGHSMVSLMSRMIPSPDWFVGVDSLDLCIDSTWLDQVTLDLTPLDAGAESGLSFTSPQWATSPPARVTKHHARDPDHPAAGFYYPTMRELPAIGTVSFTKIKEYSTIELNNLARNDLMSKMKSHINNGRIDHIDYNMESDNYDGDISREIPKTYDRLKDIEEDPVGTPRPNIPENNVIVVTTPATTTTEPALDSDLTSMDDVVLAVAHGRKLGLGKHLPRHFRSRLHHAVNRIQPNDCLVSSWSEWSPCVGACPSHRVRRRHILRTPSAAGRKCPPLTERELCHECGGY